MRERQSELYLKQSATFLVVPFEMAPGHFANNNVYRQFLNERAAVLLSVPHVAEKAAKMKAIELLGGSGQTKSDWK